MPERRCPRKLMPGTPACRSSPSSKFFGHPSSGTKGEFWLIWVGFKLLVRLFA